MDLRPGSSSSVYNSRRQKVSSSDYERITVDEPGGGGGGSHSRRRGKFSSLDYDKIVVDGGASSRRRGGGFTSLDYENIVVDGGGKYSRRGSGLLNDTISEHGNVSDEEDPSGKSKSSKRRSKEKKNRVGKGNPQRASSVSGRRRSLRNSTSSSEGPTSSGGGGGGNRGFLSAIARRESLRGGGGGGGKLYSQNRSHSQYFSDDDESADMSEDWMGTAVYLLQRAFADSAFSDICLWLFVVTMCLFMLVFYTLPTKTDCESIVIQSSLYSWEISPHRLKMYNTYPPLMGVDGGGEGEGGGRSENKKGEGKQGGDHVPVVCVLGLAQTTGHVRQMVRSFPGLYFFVDVMDEPAARRGFIDDRVYVLPIPAQERVARIAEMREWRDQFGDEVVARMMQDSVGYEEAAESVRLAAGKESSYGPFWGHVGGGGGDKKKEKGGNHQQNERNGREQRKAERAYKVNEESRWVELANYAVDEIGVPCDYFFVLDPDTVWWSSALGLAHFKTGHTSEILLRMLQTYQPLVVGFPWVEGEARFDSLRILSYQYRQSVLQPLTGFDTRNLVFHKSVFWLFNPVTVIPDALASHRDAMLLASGGIDGSIVRSVYLNFFIPFLLRERAVRFNALESDSLLPAPQLVSSHNAAGRAMIRSLVRSARSVLRNCFNGRWGPELEPDDILWLPMKADKQARTREQQMRKGGNTEAMNKIFNPRLDVLFFDITAPIYAQHPHVAAFYTESDLRAIATEYADEQMRGSLIENNTKKAAKLLTEKQKKGRGVETWRETHLQMLNADAFVDDKCSLLRSKV
eukprot:Nk52_evm74s151 gene=Nk52_evmTU74s151